MTVMTNAERLFAALRRHEPDRVPHFELYFDPKVAQALAPGGAYSDIVERFDWDAVFGGGGGRRDPIDASGKYYRNEWGVVVRVAAGMGHPVEAAVKSEKDLKKWKTPDPDNPDTYKSLAELVKRYKGKRAIMTGFRDPFAIANDVRGAADHYMDFIRNPGLVDRLSGMIRDYLVKYTKNAIEVGAEIVLISGDFATTEHPMLSSKAFTKHVMPVTKSLVKTAQSLGALTIKHTDGNIMPIMDMLLDTGIDGLNPIDPLAGMDLGEVKKKYGDRVCLLGNVNCAQTLTWGTTEEVRAEVRKCISQAAPGGGYVCMSSNSIHSAVKPENYLAMVQAIHDFGNYPISLDS